MAWRGLSLGLLAAVSCAGVAAAQLETRNRSQTVAKGREVQIGQWLAFDEATCTASGSIGITITKQPSLGSVRSENSTVAPSSGNCAGRRMPVLFVYYRAGNTAGSDSLAYTIVGGRQILNNYAITVR
jgi:hypothetical protein